VKISSKCVSASTCAVVTTIEICAVMFAAISILLTFVDVWLAVIVICNLVFNKLSRKHTQFSTINFSMHKAYIYIPMWQSVPVQPVGHTQVFGAIHV